MKILICKLLNIIVKSNTIVRDADNEIIKQITNPSFIEIKSFGFRSIIKMGDEVIFHPSGKILHIRSHLGISECNLKYTLYYHSKYSWESKKYIVDEYKKENLSKCDQPKPEIKWG